MMKLTELYRPTEDDIQEAVVEYCDLMHIVCVHIPNESKRSAAYGAKMKRMGLRKGFPDLFIPTARQGFHGLFIELKRDRLAYPKKEQREWIEYLNRQGYHAVICWGVDEAIDEIKKYMLYCQQCGEFLAKDERAEDIPKAIRVKECKRKMPNYCPNCGARLKEVKE